MVGEYIMARFPSECSSLLLHHGDYSFKILKEFCVAGQIDTSVVSCFTLVMFVCSLKECSSSLVQEACSLVELLFIPNQQVKMMGMDKM